MKLINRKRRIKIEKRLAAICYIAGRGFDGDPEHDTESMRKIIRNVSEIAFEIGGIKSTICDIPMLIYDLEHELTKEEAENAENH